MPDIFVASGSEQPKKEEEKEKEEVKAGSSEEKGSSKLQPEEKVTDQDKSLSPAKSSSARGSAAPLAALMINPPRVYFQTQETDEEVILLLRRHWVTNLPWIFFGGLMFLAPPFAFFFIPFLDLPLDLSSPVFLLGQIFWYLITFGYFFVNFLIWYFNAHIVTNERAVDIDFHNLVYKEVSSTRIELIQDVTFTMGGVIRHMFNYGDVFIQTAGAQPNFDFLAAPKPALVAHKLNELMEKVREGKDES